MVAGDIQALDGELARDAAEKIRSEDECSFQEYDDDDGACGEFFLNLFRHGVEALLDDSFIYEDSFDIVFHGRSVREEVVDAK